jgi:hypothetical protein
MKIYYKNLGEKYPEAVFMTTPDQKLLVWSDEASSENDDGSRAFDVDWGDMTASYREEFCQFFLNEVQ